jgi:hypothetical protein
VRKSKHADTRKHACTGGVAKVVELSYYVDAAPMHRGSAQWAIVRSATLTDTNFRYQYRSIKQIGSEVINIASLHGDLVQSVTPRGVAIVLLFQTILLR